MSRPSGRWKTPKVGAGAEAQCVQGGFRDLSSVSFLPFPNSSLCLNLRAAQMGMQLCFQASVPASVFGPS